ncbi:MAG: hypothetical protein H6625_12065 [Bdellovibrionaceae bacterium]|nr:hypothetical protein [Pseudobdellovibrionaceae bacterium]
MRRFFLFFIFFPLFQLPAMARAKVYQLYVKESVNVYEEPSAQSEVLKVLKPGEQWDVRLSKKKYFLLIDLPEDEISEAYIYTKQLKQSKIKKINKPQYEISDKEAYSRFSAGNALGLRYSSVSMIQQGYQDVVNEVSYQFSEFKSTHSVFEIQWALPTTTQWQWRIGLLSIKTNFKSSANVTSINKKNIPVTREQSLFGLSFNAHYYFSKDSSFYSLFSFEIDKGTELKLEFDDQNLVAEDKDLPLFVIGKIGLGMDHNLWKSLYLCPEIQLGLDFNAEPLILIYNFSLGLNWQI